MERAHDDTSFVADIAERLAHDIAGADRSSVQRTVREELEQLRRTARVQTFVPILAERHARQRLRTGPVAR